MQRVVGGEITARTLKGNGLMRANERALAQVAIDWYAPVTARSVCLYATKAD